MGLEQSVTVYLQQSLQFSPICPMMDISWYFHDILLIMSGLCGSFTAPNSNCMLCPGRRFGQRTSRRPTHGAGIDGWKLCRPEFYLFCSNASYFHIFSYKCFKWLRCICSLRCLACRTQLPSDFHALPSKYGFITIGTSGSECWIGCAVIRLCFLGFKYLPVIEVTGRLNDLEHSEIPTSQQVQKMPKTKPTKPITHCRVDLRRQKRFSWWLLQP